MNSKNAKQYLPLVQALAEGKTIQFRIEQGDWVDLVDTSFGFPPDAYRVKPVPREYWVVQTPTTTVTYHNKQTAMDDVKIVIGNGSTAELIHVREVL